VLKKRVKIVLKVKSKSKSETPIMDYLEKQLWRVPRLPFFELSKASYQKLRQEFKIANLTNCWADERFGPNYRGVLIKIHKGGK